MYFSLKYFYVFTFLVLPFSETQFKTLAIIFKLSRVFSFVACFAFVYIFIYLLFYLFSTVNFHSKSLKYKRTRLTSKAPQNKETLQRNFFINLLFLNQLLSFCNDILLSSLSQFSFNHPRYHKPSYCLHYLTKDPSIALFFSDSSSFALQA